MCAIGVAYAILLGLQHSAYQIRQSNFLLEGVGSLHNLAIARLKIPFVVRTEIHLDWYESRLPYLISTSGVENFREVSLDLRFEISLRSPPFSTLKTYSAMHHLQKF